MTTVEPETARFHFFSGKGGVGKTTMACTFAVHSARKGRKTLIVSTDPASNLSDVFETDIGHRHVKVADNLWALEIDPDKAAEEFREKVVGPMRGIMPEDIIKVMEEQFRSSCTVEIAAFDRFTDLLIDTNYDTVVLDTAPTGHTIRLLELPIDWSKHIEESLKGSGNSCVGPVSSLRENQEKYKSAIDAMRDRQTTVFNLVTRPDKVSVGETCRAHGELVALGISNFRLICNGVVPSHAVENTPFQPMQEAQRFWIQKLVEALPYEITPVELRSREVKGMQGFSAMASTIFDGAPIPVESSFGTAEEFAAYAPGSSWSRLLGENGRNRALVFSGKGGVGKTVVAVAAAVKLVKDGHRTLLVTTDPAAHTGLVLEAEVGGRIAEVRSVPGLSAVRIDQKTAVEDYRAKIVSDAEAKGYNEDMLLALREELESPCTEEMAVFDEFSKLVDQTDFARVVFDTAPTGHTLRLLNLPYDYARQVEMLVEVRKGEDSVSDAKERLDRLLRKLKDPDQTAFISVIYPEYTPIFEARRAAEDLAEAEIVFQAVIANFVLDKNDCGNRFFEDRYWMQQHYLNVAAGLSDKPMFKIRMFPNEIIGVEAIEKLIDELF